MTEQHGNGDGHSGDSASDPERPVKRLDSVVIRFAGDSGDGMQLTGTEFTRTAALFGNDIATFPDFPSEIRAPAGSLAGVSGFQLQFSSNEIFTAGDEPEVLVAMNPAALRTNLPDLQSGGLLIVNSGAFKAKNLELAGYASNPLEDGSLSAYRVVPIDFGKHVSAALQGAGLSIKEVSRTQNFFALGLLFWLYGREPAREIESIRSKFTKNPEFGAANVKAFETGYHLGETLELFDSTYSVPPAKLGSGHYRNITGNEATALGLVAAGRLAKLPILYASYPITPASDVLHNLASYTRYGVSTFQAEDEIAAVGAAIGASFGGSIGVTGTSGPGFALKQEAIGLAVAVELPLVVVNVQRAGPSTGMPTKTEQADLLQAIVGRNGESPIAVVAPATPAECFDLAIEAVRLAVEHMCPVAYLSDGSLANGAEPWRLPKVEDLAPIHTRFRTEVEGFAPFLRDERLVRPWAVPGTPGLEHRIGGIEKEDVTGNISYEPENHEHMTHTRQAKIDKIADRLPPAQIDGPPTGDVLIVGWGGTYGALRQAAHQLRAEGHAVGHLHLRYLNPLQSNVGALLARYRRVVVAELNLGQLRSILRDKFLVDARGLNKIQGKPFKVREVVEAVRKLLPAAASRELHA
ncbi:MAG: 2-oxoacid:acceptor oxidoreductase subunit alpha [Deltaproteobacteria bacterium]|nr:2-oxoacid:acceptor oxidoreductase subunit alpha [Deltaproteobacteria bacterium]